MLPLLFYLRDTDGSQGEGGNYAVLSASLCGEPRARRRASGVRRQESELKDVLQAAGACLCGIHASHALMLILRRGAGGSAHGLAASGARAPLSPPAAAGRSATAARPGASPSSTPTRARPPSFRGRSRESTQSASAGSTAPRARAMAL